jgi:hypothetical protein
LRTQRARCQAGPLERQPAVSLTFDKRQLAGLFAIEKRHCFKSAKFSTKSSAKLSVVLESERRAGAQLMALRKVGL